MLASCGNAQRATFTQKGANFFGATITADGAIDLSQAVQTVSDVDTMEVKVSGIINEVCQAKGCWMSLEDSKKSTSALVQFKDYGFFMPKDAGGKKAIVKGFLYSSMTPIDELRHYAEDKGASKEEIAAITEPKREIKMMVEGVIIYND